MLQTPWMAIRRPPLAENAIIEGEPLLAPARVRSVSLEEGTVLIEFPAGSVPRKTRWRRKPGTVGSRIPARAVAALYREAPGAEMPWHIEDCSVTAWFHFVWEAWAPYLCARIAELEAGAWTMCTPFDELSAEASLETRSFRRRLFASAPEQVIEGARFDMRRANLV